MTELLVNFWDLSRNDAQNEWRNSVGRNDEHLFATVQILSMDEFLVVRARVRHAVVDQDIQLC